MRLINRKNHSPPEVENPYWISFSDIMAGLLAIFILTLVTLMIQLHEQIIIQKDVKKRVENALRELANIDERRKELVNEIQENLQKKGIIVEIQENHSVIRIPDDQLYFNSGEHNIIKKLEKLVDQVGSVLEIALSRKDRMQYIDTIFIEGHTDSLPFREGEMGNWGLSSYRAIAVWKFWTEKPGNQKSFSKMKNRNGKKVFSVSGYASTRRVEVIEDTNSKRKKNRRIDLRFSMKIPDAVDLNKILDEFKNAGS
jgi:flagellar motor protein MotB